MMALSYLLLVFPVAYRKGLNFSKVFHLNPTYFQPSQKLFLSLDNPVFMLSGSKLGVVVFGNPLRYFVLLL